jgi:hypothetical protein
LFSLDVLEAAGVALRFGESIYIRVNLMHGGICDSVWTYTKGQACA